jgi:hypothetical protein
MLFKWWDLHPDTDKAQAPPFCTYRHCLSTLTTPHSSHYPLPLNPKHNNPYMFLSQVKGCTNFSSGCKCCPKMTSGGIRYFRVSDSSSWVLVEARTRIYSVEALQKTVCMRMLNIHLQNFSPQKNS